MEKLILIQALRFIAALMVMFAHMVPEFLPIGVHGVDIFFCVSGFIMVHTSLDLFNSTGGWRRFLIRRITRLVPLYWLMTVVTAIAAGTFSWQHIVTSMLFIPSDWADATYSTLPVLAVGWSLNVEMFFYLVFAMWLRCSRQVAIAGVSTVLISMVLIGIYTPFLPAVLKMYWASPQILEFVVGCLLASAYHDGAHIPVAPKLHPFIARLTDELGNISYALYLVHPYVMWKLGGPVWLQAVGSIVVSVAVQGLVEKPLTSYTRRMLSQARTAWKGRAIAT